MVFSNHITGKYKRLLLSLSGRIGLAEIDVYHQSVRGSIGRSDEAPAEPGGTMPLLLQAYVCNGSPQSPNGSLYG